MSSQWWLMLGKDHGPHMSKGINLTCQPSMPNPLGVQQAHQQNTGEAECLPDNDEVTIIIFSESKQQYLIACKYRNY